MARYSRRNFLAVGGASTSLGILGYHANPYTKARITSILSPLPGIRATGNPLTVRKKVVSQNVEYLPKTNEVRIVVARNSEGPVEFATRPFEQWAELECGSIATEEVYSDIQATFGAHVDIMSGMGFGNGQPFVSTAPTEPAVTRREMVEKLPNHVTVTMEFADKDYKTEIPVIVKKYQKIYLA